ncbi:MAG: type VI secretion system protein TssR domain-containing protein, partial [Chitinophagales bacterium]
YQILNIPIKYGTPQEDVNYNPVSEQETSSALWFVASDRDNNTTYQQPNGTERMQVIHFLDKFYVVGESGEYLRLVKPVEDDNDALVDIKGELYVHGEDFGWIHKKYLLLWRHCIISPKRMDTKAMLLNTVETISKDNITVKDLQKATFYKEPNLSAESGNTARLFNFFFVYKREGDAILLGKDNFIRDYYTDYENIVMGWVPANKVIQWDHRVVTEPNWESPAVKERINNNTKAAVFYGEFDAKAYQGNHQVNRNRILWAEKTISKERELGQRIRFPIIMDDKEHLKVGAMGQIYNYDGEVDRESYEDLRSKVTKLKSLKRNVNIVFVVDGTQGMASYCKAIGDVILESNSTFRNSLNTVRFGAVVYRDIDAGQVTQRKLLNSDRMGVASFFHQEINTSFDDNDLGDAVNNGIYTAIKSLSLSKKETNFIVLVGGSPNHQRNDDSQVSSQELVSLMDKYNCHLFSFLVDNQEDSKYGKRESQQKEDLIYQVKDLLLEVANKKYKTLAANQRVAEVIKKTPDYLQKPRLKPYPRKQNLYQLEKTAVMGSSYHAEFGTKMDIADFKEELLRILVDSEEKTNALLDRIEYKVWGFGNEKPQSGEASTFGASIEGFLQSILTEDQIRTIRDDNIQLYQPGYAPKLIEGQKFPLFKYSLFLTRLELLELYNQMKKFSKATTSVNNARREMQEVYLDILSTYLGNEDDSFLQMDLQEINQYIFGLPGTSDFLKDITVSDITRTDRFTNADFNRFVARLENKLQTLGDIVNSADYSYSFKSNDISYYWLSEDFIP